MEEVVKPLGGHAVLFVLIQLGALLTVARLGSELVKRLGLPTVVGELAAGVVLGPSFFGHYFPGTFRLLFPPEAEQWHLLEIISWVGLVLLMLLTGIETDVRLLRNLGRSALAASLFGMAVPFVFGLGLGWWIPGSYVAQPDHRMLFALFLATAMSISAMPVIAKILLDLDLTRRNIGVVILSAGVVDDTTGWIILSLIAGAAAGGAQLRGLAISVGGTAVFVAVAAFVLYPILKYAFRVAGDRFESKDTDLVLMLVVTLFCAAATDYLGVHAVFGAFVAGCVIRQVPHFKPQTLHKLESFTFPVFAPIFFGIVGLKVDLWQLGDWRMLILVLTVASAGKLVGCTAGALLGGLTFWESISIAVAMNTRGAMELVVATIGLSLGILNQQMYSIVVMVAVATSFMAPVLLRLTMRRIRVTEDEAERMAAEEARGLFDAEKLRVLVPTAGGPNALVAAKLGMCIAHRSAHPITMLYVERVSGWFDALTRSLRGPTVEGRNLQQHLDEIRSVASEASLKAPEVRKAQSRLVSTAVNSEAAKDYDLILTGASGTKRGIRGQKLEDLVSGAPCHVAIVKHRGASSGPFKRLLVPVDGSYLSRVGIEFAIRYAEGAGPDAEVTFAIITEPAEEERRVRPSSLDMLDTPSTGSRRRKSIILGLGTLAQEGGLDKLSPVFKATKVKTRLIAVDGAAGGSVVEHARSGSYDLLVVGAEHRAIHHRLFFGYEKERLVEESLISVVLLVPKVEM